MKNINLIYFSATDTTKKIVEAIAQGLGDTYTEYNITLPDARKQRLQFTCEDLVIIGAPVYAGRVLKIAMDYFETVKGNNTHAIFVVLYGNRDYDDALLELKNSFEQKGFIGIAGGSFVGEHSLSEKIAHGRPDAEDIAKAKEFGLQIRECLEAKSTNTKYDLKVKGNYPYKDGMPSGNVFGPKTNDNCTKCGICADFCPTGAISFDNFIDIRVEVCIRCSSCVKRCPADAKHFDQEPVLAMKNKLESNLVSVRKEPEWFIGEV